MAAELAMLVTVGAVFTGEMAVPACLPASERLVLATRVTRPCRSHLQPPLCKVAVYHRGRINGITAPTAAQLFAAADSRPFAGPPAEPAVVRFRRLFCALGS